MEKWFDQRRVMVLIGVLFLSGVGIYFYQQSCDKKEQEGKSALYKVQKTYEEELKALPESDRSGGGLLDVDAKFSKTVAELKGILSAKTASNRILFEASFKLGTLYLDHQQTAKAEEAMKSGLPFAKGGFQKATLQYLLGMALEETRKFTEAKESFKSALSENIDGLKGEILLGLVRTSLKSNDAASAKTYGEKLTKEFAGSKFAEASASLLKDRK